MNIARSDGHDTANRKTKIKRQSAILRVARQTIEQCSHRGGLTAARMPGERDLVEVDLVGQPMAGR